MPNVWPPHHRTFSRHGPLGASAKPKPRPRPTSRADLIPLNTNDTLIQGEKYTDEALRVNWIERDAPIQLHGEDHGNRDELIKPTKEVLQRHRGVHRSGKGWRRSGKHGSHKTFSNRAKSARAKPDDKRELRKMDVNELYYSQATIKRTFSCGRPVSRLLKDLWTGKVDLSAPFLRLTVFETTYDKTNELIMRCIDNRRLYVLKEYALLIEEPVKVNVDLFSYNTLVQARRFIQNSDVTNGRDVRIRNNNMKRRWSQRHR